MIDAADLPDDIDVLKAMVLASDGDEQRHVGRIAQLESCSPTLSVRSSGRSRKWPTRLSLSWPLRT